MAHNKSSPGIVTAPLPESDVSWLDLVFQMDKLNDAMARFAAVTNRNPASHVGQNPPFRSSGAFGPEVIAAMCEALEAACKELGDDLGQPGVRAWSSPNELSPRQNLVSVTRFACRQPRSANRTNDPFVHPIGRSRAVVANGAARARLSFTGKGTLVHG
jgi:hypothetical protein